MTNLMSLMAKKSHPMSRFTIGNKNTLKKEGVTDALNNFYQNFYSSNKMALTVISSHSIEELQRIVLFII